MTGCGLAEADEVRRTLGSREGQAEVEAVVPPAWPAAQGFDEATVDRVWEVLKAFASFGFCKAHAAAFALPTYQSAWLKAHHPAAFLAGVLTHDPGMYPKRLILDDARNLGIAVLPLDVNRSQATYRVEKVTWWDEPPPRVLTSSGTPSRRAERRASRPARRARLRHPALPRRREGHHRRRGRADRRGPALPLARRLLAPRRGVPPGRRAARRGRRLRHPLRPRVAGPRPPPRPGHPARPAAPGRRARPLDPCRRPRAHARRARLPARGTRPGAGREPRRRRPRRRTSSARRPPASRRLRGRAAGAAAARAARPRPRRRARRDPRPRGWPR